MISLQSIWPGMLFTARAVVRAAVLWLLIHGVLMLGSGEVTPLSVVGLVWFMLIAFAVGYVDGRHDRTLLQNAGVSPSAVPSIWSATAGTLELILTLAAR